jgi:uncharacterized protein (TIGR02145 family)
MWLMLISGCKEQSEIPASGKFIDNRDKLEYSWVTVGTQTWMAENLAWLPEVSPPDIGSTSDPVFYVMGYMGTDANEARKTEGYSSYGVFYNWLAAMNRADTTLGSIYTRGICPEKWHLPSDQEWDILINFLGGEFNAGKKMKSTKGWESFEGVSGRGDNSSGFDGLPAGSRINAGKFYDTGYNALFWTATGSGEYSAWYRHLIYSHEGVNRYFLSKSWGLSVRCVKD